ncbi:uncharacterized protein AB9W97_003161 [Spinachia spinachia]
MEDKYVSKLSPAVDFWTGMYLITIAVLSILGNMAILVSAARRSGPLKAPELLTVNLAVTDLGMALTMYPLSTASAFNHAWIGGDASCLYYSLMGMIFSITSIVTLAVMGMVRYLVTGNPPRRGLRLQRRTVSMLISAIWVYSGLWALFPLLGWGSYGPEPFGLACSIDWSSYGESLNHSTFITTLSVLCTFLPCLVIFFTYFGIAWKLRRAYQSIRSDGFQHGQVERKITLMAAMISSGFLFSWTPYLAVSLWSMFRPREQGHIPPLVALLPCLFAKSSTVYNPFIYFIFQRSSWQEVLRLQRRLFCCWHRGNSPGGGRKRSGEVAKGFDCTVLESGADGASRASGAEGGPPGKESGSQMMPLASLMDIYASTLSPAVDIGAGCYLLLVAVFSIAGNLLVLVMAVKRWSRMKPPELLSVNLAVTDLGAAVTMYPLAVASAWRHRWLGGDAACVYYAVAGFFFGLASIMSLTGLAIVRFVVSLNLQSTNEKIGWRKVKLLCAWTWLYALVWAVFPFLGWGRYGPEPSGLSCSLAWGQMKHEGFSFVVSMFSLNLVLPCVVIAGCYFGIAIKLYRKSSNSSNRLHNVVRRHRRLMAIAVLISLGFVVCWSPYAIVSLWSIFRDSGSIPPEVSLLPCMFAKSSTVYNPLIYYIFSQSFRREVKQLWRRLGSALCSVSNGVDDAGVSNGDKSNERGLSVLQEVTECRISD